jgi:hypothetical protein
VVLILECPYSERQVKEWLKVYNQTAQYKLTFCDVLYNQLFVVWIEGAPDLSIQQGLIDRSPLLAKDTFAAVNLYHRYKQLVWQESIISSQFALTRLTPKLTNTCLMWFSLLDASYAKTIIPELNIVKLQLWWSQLPVFSQDLPTSRLLEWTI